jgi:L-Ala-D/L-Glu epimerase
MKIQAQILNLELANPWKIASTAGSRTHQTVVVQMVDAHGHTGIGEAAPSALYGESAAGVLEAIGKVNASELSFADVPAGMNYLAGIGYLPVAANCALNIALLDGAARMLQQPLHDFLGLGFREHRHMTSYSIGIDAPEVIRKKVQAAAGFPVLKLKVGDLRDRENFAALREIAPDKPVRLDANEGWQTKEQALRMLEWLVTVDDKIQFVEQPMPRTASTEALRWLKARSPLPLFADESCHTLKDIPRCAECFHGVNVKLVKAGGVSMAKQILEAARRAGLKTMIGCMIETSILISAAAHLAELADHLDIDGNLLITNDPFSGVTAEKGILSFATAEEKQGLRVKLRPVHREPA